MIRGVRVEIQQANCLIPYHTENIPKRRSKIYDDRFPFHFCGSRFLGVYEVLSIQQFWSQTDLRFDPSPTSSLTYVFEIATHSLHALVFLSVKNV